ncbi:hypothetical protein JS531_10070 [Bifidobacterium sp. CP2]|uniref:sugar-binding transcriptional regulator n=1 Tax=Bifidobacterium sp. CP2 TaxID=2809025 RepID=UPI001BDDB855|nr:sugar-binding domain-containing protein [Bifidobacterium sp. CP2]MBT1182282.1 hypothetical protein [Bifidobacterium sp. CP2]
MSSPAHLQLLADVANRFYMLDETKSEIAQALGMSRFKVARLLTEAKETGVVTIEIHADSPISPALAEQLRQHLLLDEVIIVPSSRDMEAERDSMGRAGARYLETHLREGQVVGFSWGRTLMPIATHVHDLPRATFVQLTGVVGNNPSQSPIAILTHMCQNTDSQAKALFAPLFSSSPQAAAAAKTEPAAAETLSYYSKLDLAFLSVGAWNTRVTQLIQHMSAADIKLLDSVGATADFSGMFFDAEGHYLDLPINDCRISVGIDDLLATPTTVVVAGGKDKTDAILAICRTGIPTCLITTEDVAHALLGGPRITTHIHQRKTA